MSRVISKKSKVAIIVLGLILVIVIALLGISNLTQTSQNGKELHGSMRILGKEKEDIEKLDINKASVESLIKLPGIGPVKAKAIIDYRDKIGKYESLYELTNVKGIGKETMSKLEPYLEVVGDSNAVKSSQISENVITNTSKININAASINELILLPGIGEKKAQAIVKYREEIGNFKTKDDIKNVKGIGESIYKTIKSKIEVK